MSVYVQGIGFRSGKVLLGSRYGRDGLCGWVGDWARIHSQQDKSPRPTHQPPTASSYVPPSERPEVQFVPSLITDFVEVMDQAIVEGMEVEDDDRGEGAVPPSLDRGALLYCERSLELLVDLLSQV